MRSATASWPRSGPEEGVWRECLEPDLNAYAGRTCLEGGFREAGSVISATRAVLLVVAPVACALDVRRRWQHHHGESEDLEDVR
jgi:hypothetical protein